MSIVSFSQTSSVISVYIKIIDYSGSVSSLNNTMRTKHAAKNRQSYSNINKIYLGLFFVMEESLLKKLENLWFLMFQEVGTVFNVHVSSFLEVLFFLCAIGIIETGFK